MTKETKKKRKKWIKPRHKIITTIAYAILYPYTIWRYHIKIEPFSDHGKRQFLILLNHQTPFDQFFVGMSFRRPLYYLATEDLFSNGWISSVIRYLVAPIPIKKQTTDIAAVMNCMRVAKEGGSIVIAPEGNRTYSGKTQYMNPAIATLARKLRLPIALYRIEGGYGTEPRWSDCIRRGKMRAYVSRVMEPEEYASLTDAELYDLIVQGLFVNEGVIDTSFYHRKKAEYLERAIYVCPKCGLSTFESHGDVFKCNRCDLQVQYMDTKELKGTDDAFPFRFVTEWYDYQCDFINQLDTRAYIASPLYRDHARLSKVIVYKKKVLLRKEAEISLYGDRIVIDEQTSAPITFPFQDVSAVSVLGRNKLNIYYDKNVYQLKGNKRFNALKYVNIYYRQKNLTRGDANDKFLGL